jgi:tetratricopeptide (TPR) repeat protein
VVECYRLTGRNLETEPLLKLAIAIVERNAGPDNVNLARILHYLANLYRKYGRYEEAEPLYRRQLAIAEKADPSEPDLGTALNEIGVFFDETDRYAEAEAAYRRALTVEEKRLGPDARGIGPDLRNLATLYLKLGRYEEADALVTRALVNAEQPIALKKTDNPAIATERRNADIITGLTLRADLNVARGRYAEAESDYRRGLALAATVRESSPGIASAVLIKELAELYLKQERYTEAEPLFQRVLGIEEKAFGSNNHWVVEILDGLGTAYHHLGRDAEAEASFTRALLIGQQVLGDRHVDVGNILSNLAAFRLATGRLADALESARKGVDVASALIIQSVNGVGLPTQSLRSHFEVALAVLRRASDRGARRSGPCNGSLPNGPMDESYQAQ